MMKNTFYHPSLPSEFFSIGNSELRIANLGAPSLMDTKMSIHNNGCYFHPPRSFPADNNWLWVGGVGSLDFSDQYILDLQPGPSTLNIPHLPIKNLPILPPAGVFQLPAMSKTRKHQLEAEERLIAGEGFGESPISGNWKKSKRKRVMPQCSSQCHHECSQAGLPVKRSQRIGDKITAMQKLVSPYGKTDTASVLLEASLYINLLQEQIQNLLQLLTNSYASIRGMQAQVGSVKACGETSVDGECQDLQSRGICLVPISSVQEVATKSHIGDTTIY